MKKLIFYCLLAMLVNHTVMSQATFTTTGSWDVATNWSGSNIGDLISEDVTINNNRSALINNGFSYTIGNLGFGNNTGLTINSTGTLNVGDAGNSRSVTINNTTSITVTGTLIIWGDLIVNNTLTLSVAGTLIVKGNVQMNNGSSISVTGSVDVDGDFTGGNNTNVSISGGGSINVDGDVGLGNNSNLTGPPGSFTVGGGCTQGGGSSFCDSGALPVDLLYFNAKATTNAVRLTWSTASELNSDFFEVQKSVDGLVYESLSKVTAQGNSVNKVDYEITDEKPKVGRAYYRLRQVDLDGKDVIYSVVIVEFTGARSVAVYPNPIKKGSDLIVQLNFEPEYPVEVTIKDLSGRQIERVMLSESGASFSGYEFNAGLYIVWVNSPEFKGLSKFVVLE